MTALNHICHDRAGTQEHILPGRARPAGSGTAGKLCHQTNGD